MKASVIKDKMENRLKLFNRKIEPSSMYSAIADAANFVLRKFTTTNTVSLGITTAAGAGTYEISAPSSYFPWRITIIDWPSAWDGKIEFRLKSQFDELVRQLDNTEITVLSDQPTFYTTYYSGGKRYLQLMDASTVAASLTISIQLSVLFDGTVVGEDFDLPIPVELTNLLFYKSLAEFLPPLDVKLAGYYEGKADKEIFDYDSDAIKPQRFEPIAREIWQYPTG